MINLKFFQMNTNKFVYLSLDPETRTVRISRDSKDWTDVETVFDGSEDEKKQYEFIKMNSTLDNFIKYLKDEMGKINCKEV